MRPAEVLPDLDYAAAWRGGSLLSDRTERNVAYVGHVDYYGLACRPKGHHKAERLCKCGCGDSTPYGNGPYLNGHRPAEETERRRIAELARLKQWRATPSGLAYTLASASKRTEKRLLAKLAA